MNTVHGHYMTADASTRPLSKHSLTPLNVQHGQIVNLRHRDVQPDSILWNWKVDNGIFGHPFVIAGTRNSSAIACCVLTTSFGGSVIQNKFRGNSEYVQRRLSASLAIDHGNTVCHNNASLLSLGYNQRMDKQSYVVMDSFFEVEVKYLELWNGNVNQHSPLCLASSSLGRFQQAFSQYVISHPPRQTGAVYSPLDLWFFTPDSLGVLAAPGMRSGRRGSHGPTTRAGAPPHPHGLKSAVATTVAAAAPWTASSWREPNPVVLAPAQPTFVPPPRGNRAIAIVRP